MGPVNHDSLESIKLLLNCSYSSVYCLYEVTSWYICLCEQVGLWTARNLSIYFVLLCILERHKSFCLYVTRKKETLMLLSGVYSNCSRLIANEYFQPNGLMPLVQGTAHVSWFMLIYIKSNLETEFLRITVKLSPIELWELKRKTH